MPVQDVTVVSVPVSDQDRAKAFYVDTLGFQLIRDDDSVPGIRWVQVSPQSGATALTLVTWFGTMPAGGCMNQAPPAPRILAAILVRKQSIAAPAADPTLRSGS